jgi:hypothetical protein
MKVISRQLLWLANSFAVTLVAGTVQGVAQTPITRPTKANRSSASFNSTMTRRTRRLWRRSTTTSTSRTHSERSWTPFKALASS